MSALIAVIAPPLICAATFAFDSLRARKRKRVEKSQSDQESKQGEAK